MDNDAMHKPVPQQPATPTLLQDLTWLLGAVFERLAACEGRTGCGYVDHAGTAERLQRLMNAAATGNGNSGSLTEVVRRLDALTARVAELEERLAHQGPSRTGEQPSPRHRQTPAASPSQTDRGALRRAIERIVADHPGAAASAVLKLLAVAPGCKPPSLRTVRHHMKSLRDGSVQTARRAAPRSNGNGLEVLR